MGSDNASDGLSLSQVDWFYSDIGVGDEYTYLGPTWTLDSYKAAISLDSPLSTRTTTRNMASPIGLIGVLPAAHACAAVIHDPSTVQ